MSKHIDKILKNKADPVEQPDNKEEPKTVEKEDLQNELLAKVESLQDKLLRNIAEMENVRKRASKEIEEMKKYSRFFISERFNRCIRKHAQSIRKHRSRKAFI